MKKRRPCAGSQSRSQKNSPKSSDPFPIRSKSTHDLKRTRRTSRILTVPHSPIGENHSYNCRSQEVFGSLESLFDVRKPLHLPSDICLPLTKTTLEGDSVQQNGKKSILDEFVSLEHFAPEYEPNVLVQISEIQENASKFDTLDEISEESIDTGTRGEDSARSYEEDKFTEVDEMENDQIVPAHDVPSGYCEGVPIKEGGNRDSTLSTLPWTDTAVMQELQNADKRCVEIKGEIKQLRQEVNELKNKKDLSEEDAKIAKLKQDAIMEKLSEFEAITRKLEKLLGLADPSSQTFARMFEMLPYPHTKEKAVRTECGVGAADKMVCTDKYAGRFAADICAEMGKMNKDLDDDEFDIPEQYPEDKLPRVIVCGHTEENIPKIVVADSQRHSKGKQCLQTLTGKLTESLTMQEKLAKENAQLEGGKYKLEEALLEKDNTVDSLQKKVCGLQAEMRIVVKENSELSKQLVCLNQRVATPSCCQSCPGANSNSNSSPSSPRAASCGYENSSRRENDSFPHKQNLFRRNADPNIGTPGAGNACRQPDCCKSQQGNSMRLSGGASRGGDCCMSEKPSPRKQSTCSNSCPPEMPPTCPAEMQSKLCDYGNSTKQIAQQLSCIESEVRTMQAELLNVQREREQLEQQRKLLKCTGPCAPCSCCPPPVDPCAPPPCPPPPCPPSPCPPPPCPPPPCKSSPPAPPTCAGPCTDAPLGGSSCPQQQLRDLREQYCRLQEDYKNKLCEVSCMRNDADKLKSCLRSTKEEAERLKIKMIDMKERMKNLEDECEKLKGSKEQLVEQEQALVVAKQRFREAQDELEELRSLIQDQACQLEDYRNKYLKAQQQVEEQRRQLDLMEMDNARMNENVTLEIGRVKNQFQEKLAELAPLPDILKQTQLKLQETQQLRCLAEHNCEDLSRELLCTKDQLQATQSQLEVLQNENQALQNEKNQVSCKFEEYERKIGELKNESECLKNAITRCEENEATLQKRVDEKLHEIAQLNSMLEQVREDSARQVSRTKERCEAVKRNMQGQIAEMEMQLAQTRATANSAQKDRDEIRQKMQGQINNLNDAFEQAQGRIKCLQGHVNYLKTSYSNVFKTQSQSDAANMQGEFSQGYDSCDCNY